ncbi:SdpI family protein [Paenibacillus sp. NPDC057934]|uniref:SdpI family protein n=1 Tax=Paenibacillus sp. NPDC057934 TaxID=3346282 RepID=UPI0036D8180F
MMKRFFFQIGIILSSVLIGLIAYTNLPHDIAIHWIRGEPDGFIKRSFAIFIMPIVMIFSYLLSMCVNKMNKSKNKTYKENIINKVQNGVLCFLFFIHLFILAFGLGFKVNFNFFVGIFLGFVIIYLFNSVKDVKINSMYGLRTKWTMKDERVWKKANQFASNLFIVVGFLILGLSVVVTEHITLVVIGLVIVAGSISVYASYLIDKDLNN